MDIFNRPVIALNALINNNIRRDRPVPDLAPNVTADVFRCSREKKMYTILTILGDNVSSSFLTICT